jgi:tetratricopeptide (TPR) repeat protein
LINDHPAIAHYQHMLAGNYNGLATANKCVGRLQEAEGAYRDALRIAEKLAADSPTVPDNQHLVALTLCNFAALYKHQGDFAQAHQLYVQALPHGQAALKANPRHPLYWWSYMLDLSGLTQTCAGQRDQGAAVDTAVKLRDLAWNPPSDTYAAACTLALCIAIVEKDEKASEEERAKQVQFYGDQAMAMLRDAVAKGYKDAAHMKKDTDLDPLRSREDFKKLVAELEAAKP